MIYWPTKKPDAEIDYGADWAPTLSLMGDLTITGSEWSILEGDVVLGIDSFTADTTSVRVTGGTNGSDAIVKNLVTLSDGQKVPETAYLKVRA